MKINIFTKNNCSYCEQLTIPEEIKVNIINVDENYNGFRPDHFPTMQLMELNFQGNDVITKILNLIKHSQNGDYKR